jgi:hypothetical protein
MYKHFIAVVISLFVSLSVFAQAATYGGGSGTTEDPFQIWMPEQMNTIGANSGDWGKSFKLMADIDMSIYTGTQYNIIGNSTTQFTGTFDGGGHIISNLTYTTTTNYIGLFGYTSNATIQNLGVVDANIQGGDEVGGLMGRNDGVLIACYVTGFVSGTGWDVGGLVGTNAGSIIGCYAATSEIYGRNSVGGLVGFNLSGSLIACYATGLICCEHDILGGLVGENNGYINVCYAACIFDWATDIMGGLVGQNDDEGYINACLCNDINGEAVGYGSSSGVTRKTTAEMQTLSTFTSAGWDFTNEILNGTNDTWRMCADNVDYPRLNWESIGGDFSCPDGVNMEDLDYSVARWLNNDCASGNNYCGGADLNFSGAVDLADFSIFAANWLAE